MLVLIQINVQICNCNYIFIPTEIISTVCMIFWEEILVTNLHRQSLDNEMSLTLNDKHGVFGTPVTQVLMLLQSLSKLVNSSCL